MEQKPISELMNLSGKVVIVTGGAMGIGYAIASRLAEAGASVLIANLDAEKSSIAVAKLAERGWNVSSTVADVSDEGQVEAMVAKAVDEFGGVDILVNNAGIYPLKSGILRCFQTRPLGLHQESRARARAAQDPGECNRAGRRGDTWYQFLES